MSYDGLDRLTNGNGFRGSVNIGYDTLGNFTHYNFTDKGTTAYSYDTANRLTSVSGGVSRSFTYDGRGNVTANGKNTFTYNDATCVTRMAQSDVASYIYDGHGRRVKNVGANGTDYSFYDANGRLVFREKGDGTKVNYVFLAKLQVARVEDDAGTQTTKYIHTDLLGSPMVESDSTGSVLESTRMHYRPFGQTKETPKDEVGYTGHKFDTDIGLNYMQARYYDPVIGRFYSNDPVGYTAKNPVMSFNRYMYANNNPYKYTDPDGRFVKLVKAIYSIGGKVIKNGGNFKKAGKEELTDLVENFAELADGDWSMDDAYAVVDIVTGFGDEAKKAAKLVDASSNASKKVNPVTGTFDNKHVDDQIYENLAGQGDRPQDPKPASQKTVKGRVAEAARVITRIFDDLG